MCACCVCVCLRENAPAVSKRFRDSFIGGHSFNAAPCCPCCPLHAQVPHAHPCQRSSATCCGGEQTQGPDARCSWRGVVPHTWHDALAVASRRSGQAPVPLPPPLRSTIGCKTVVSRCARPPGARAQVPQPRGRLDVPAAGGRSTNPQVPHGPSPHVQARVCICSGETPHRRGLRAFPGVDLRCSLAQAAFQALPLPLEELGYSYLVCAAGGALAFDFFAGDVNLTQVVSPDFRHLTRKFTYRTSVRSVPDGDLIQACGPVIKMEVRCSVLYAVSRVRVRVACTRGCVHRMCV